MSMYRLKSRFQSLLRPVSHALAKAGVSANQVTVGATLLSVATAYVVAKPACHNQRLWLLLPVGLFLRMAMNAIDGMIAKEHHQPTTLGAFLNETGDMVSDGVLLFSLRPHLDTQHHYALYRVMALSLLTEMVAIISTQLTGERANHGPLGKSDRALLLGIIGLLVGLRMNLKPYQKPFMTLCQLGLILTVIKRGHFISKATLKT